MRSVSAVLMLLLSACASTPTFCGPSPFPEWMQRALAHPNDNPAFHRFYLAFHGKPEGLHAYFSEALRQANSPEIDVEAGEGLSWEFQTIIRHIGDAHFSAALKAESIQVQSAIASCFPDVASAEFPRTLHLVANAPKVDFPMLQTYRGEYHPSVPKG
jgi:hypothetical protein